jgi:hypothetical protein
LNFDVRLPQPLAEATLSYKFMFEENYSLGKGGAYLLLVILFLFSSVN